MITCALQFVLLCITGYIVVSIVYLGNNNLNEQIIVRSHPNVDSVCNLNVHLDQYRYYSVGIMT